MDEQLQAEAGGPGDENSSAVAWDDVPDGTFVLLDARVAGARRGLLEWTPAGYVAARRTRPSTGTTLALTPPSLIEVLRTGWEPATVPFLHPSARVSG